MIGFIAGIFVGGLFVFLVMSVLLMAREDRPAKKKRETFRERLMREHPECVSPRFEGGCKGCPAGYGYESERDGVLSCTEMGPDCTACWDREVKA